MSNSSDSNTKEFPLESGKTVHHRDTGSCSGGNGIFSHNNSTNKTNDNKDIVVITQEMIDVLPHPSL